MGKPVGNVPTGFLFATSSAFATCINVVFPTPIRQLLLSVAVALVTLLLDGTAVLLLWVEGVDFATIDNPRLGESGFRINPLTVNYKLLLGCLLATNIGIVFYMLVKQKRWYAFGFALGAVVPIAYVIRLVYS
jgi:hypothetical protein